MRPIIATITLLCAGLSGCAIHDRGYHPHGQVYARSAPAHTQIHYYNYRPGPGYHYQPGHGYYRPPTVHHQPHAQPRPVRPPVHIIHKAPPKPERHRPQRHERDAKPNWRDRGASQQPKRPVRQLLVRPEAQTSQQRESRLRRQQQSAPPQEHRPNRQRTQRREPGDGPQRSGR